jgi:hypothetical protein
MEKKIDTLLTEITRGKRENVGSLPNFHYSLADFKLDLLANSLLDWKVIINRAKGNLELYLQSVSSYNNELKDRFKVESKNGWGTSIASNDSFKSDPLDLLTDSKPETLENWLRDHITVMEDCLEFYEENKDNPPFNYPVLKEGKIPFWGTQEEFSAFINLIENRGFYFGTTRMNFDEKRGYEEVKKNSDHKLKVDFINMEKNKFTLWLANSFYLVQFENGKIKEQAINPRTLFNKMNDNSFTAIATDKKPDMIQFFKKIVKRLDPDSKC